MVEPGSRILSIGYSIYQTLEGRRQSNNLCAFYDQVETRSIRETSSYLRSIYGEAPEVNHIDSGRE